MYKVIDMKTWKRAVHCDIFRNYLEPQYCISLEIDITGFYKKIKEKNYPFTFAFIYAVAKCANDIEELRYRFKDGEVVLFDKINTSFTYIDSDDDLFKVVVVPMKESMHEYIKIARKTAENQTDYFTGPLGNDVFQFSAIPWVSYTHISHTISGKKETSTPMFDWGKFFDRDNKKILPFSVQAHHSFVDGVHIGRFLEKLQAYINEF